MEPLYWPFWGKAGRGDAHETYQPLVFHCLDVAAAGEALLEAWPNFGRFLAGRLGVEFSQLKRWARFVHGLHDLGKFGGAFQRLRKDLIETLGGTLDKGFNLKHDALGRALWTHVLSDEIESIKPPPEWLGVCFAHHGEVRGLDEDMSAADMTPERVIEAAQEFAEQWAAVCLGEEPEAQVWPGVNPEEMQSSTWWLAGWAVLADWIGSNQDFFPFCPEYSPLETYFDGALERARKAVEELGLKRAEPAELLEFSQLFPQIAVPNAMQRLAQDLPLDSGPQLVVIENLTGTGKTEAALMLAHRLMPSTGAQGLYFGLPTQATANQLYDRMGEAYARLYRPDSTPSLVLAHGNRKLDRRFQASLDRFDWVRQTRQEARQETKEGKGDWIPPAEAVCSRWFADSSKKALLADVGVGTLDQALLAILKTKHHVLRLMGLWGKVLVIDEVHAYDAYMNACLEHLLRMHAAAGGSAILLSATLPGQTRQRLMTQFAKGAGFPDPPEPEPDEAYPLLAHLGACGLSAHAVEPPPSRELPFRLVHHEAKMFDQLVELQPTGLCQAWIRNSVKEAQRTYAQLRSRLPEAKITLFHARFTPYDRQRIEGQVLEWFGKSSGPEERRGRVLVATQVLEQSLDLDLDRIQSDLAPIDLLLQRAGRQRRHLRTAQGERMTGPDAQDQREDLPFWVLSPDPNEPVQADWVKAPMGATAAIYSNHAQLWATARWLGQKGTVRLPEEAREVIEAVYDDGLKFPEALEGAFYDAEGRHYADRSNSTANRIDLKTGYLHQESLQAGEEVTSRLGLDSVRLSLCCWDGERLYPWAPLETDLEETEALKRAWAFSQVSLPRHLVPLRHPSADDLAEALNHLPHYLPQPLILVRSEAGQWRSLDGSLGYDGEQGVFEVSS